MFCNVLNKKYQALSCDLDAYFIESWLKPEAAQTLLHQALALTWQSESIRLFGKDIIVPRKVLWIADEGLHYRYSGVNHQPEPWPDFLLAVRRKLYTQGLVFNSVLANYYKGGYDYMGWHRDNEKNLGLQPTIASLSLGAMRKFVFRHKQTRQKVELMLSSGSLLVMHGACQEQWQHALPKAKCVTLPRINFTFRNIITTA